MYIAPCLIGTVFGLPILYVRSKSPLQPPTSEEMVFAEQEQFYSCEMF